MERRDTQVGDVVGERFRLLGVAGEGATGVVYRAWQLDVHRPVAVKVLHRHHLLNGEVCERFRRESLAVARLSHPNIVGVLASGETDCGLPYMVMEYVDGLALDELLRVGESLPISRATSMIRQIALALSEAHGAGIVHRDLKLANIIVSQRPGLPDMVKVVDFGIAKVERKGEFNPVLTRDGAVYGTPEYVSPEQGEGKPVDYRSDLYSLGVVFYRLVTGRLPFQGRGFNVIIAHIREQPTPPMEVNRDVDEATSQLILRLMAKDPNRRPSSAESLVAELDALSHAADDFDEGTAPTLLAGAMPAGFRHEPSRGSGFTSLLMMVALLIVGGWTIMQSGLEPAVHAHGSYLATSASESAGDMHGQVLLAATGALSMRATVPDDLSPGSDVTIVVEAWNRAGEPVTAPLRVSVEGPSDNADLVVRPSAMPGRQMVTGRLATAGRYTITIAAQGSDLELGVVVHVVDAGPLSRVGISLIPSAASPGSWCRVPGWTADS